MCLTTLATTFSGPWTESGSYSSDGLPYGVHTFVGPGGARETFDYGEATNRVDLAVAAVIEHNRAAAIAAAAAAAHAGAGVASVADIGQDQVGIDMRHTVESQGGTVVHAESTSFVAGVPQFFGWDRCPDPDQTLGFMIAVPAGSAALTGPMTRTWASHPVTTVDGNAVHFDSSAQGWDVYAAGRAGGEVSAIEATSCSLSIMVRTTATTAQPAQVLVFVAPLRGQ